MEYTVSRYKGEWAVFARTSRCYVLFGSKRRMNERARELNEQDRR